MTLEEQKRELVKQIRNRCEIFLMMDTIQPQGWATWQYTLLEDNHTDSQQLLDEYCVVR
jgi:hypothetical protein